MSKLFELKNWMTIRDTAVYLGRVLKEEVSEADIFQLALDGHLILSVDLFNHAKAVLGARVAIEDAELIVAPSIIFERDCKDKGAAREKVKKLLRQQLPDTATTKEKTEFLKLHGHMFETETLVAFYRGTEIGDGTVISFEEKIVTLSGIWDLPMVASEKLDVMHRLQQLIGGPSVELVNLDGTFLVSTIDGTYASLQGLINPDGPKTRVEGKPPAFDNPIDFYSVGSLPDDANLVVRVENVHRFLQSLDGEEKPLDGRERATLLTVIGALAGAAGIDLSRPHKAGEAIAAMLDAKGVKLSARTIGEHLKAVREAMDSRKN